MWTAVCQQFLSRFRRATQGSLALKTAMLTPVFLMGLGVAVDYARMSGAATELQSAADAAALSGAKVLMMRESTDWKKRSEDILASNIETRDNLEITGKRVTQPTDSTVRGEIFAKLKPMFPQFMGYPTYEISQYSDATYGTAQRTELAIVIDTTNSMAATSAWSTAVSSLESILDDMKTMTGQSNFFVTLVPFQNRVNVGSHRKSWLQGGRAITLEGVRRSARRKGWEL